MKKKRVLSVLVALSMTAFLAACGGNSGGGASSAAPAASSEASSAASTEASEPAETPSGEVTTVNLWAAGSDNVRASYEALIAEYNANEEFNGGQYQIELNFLLSGTGAQTLPDMIAAAVQAGQTGTDFDLLDLGGDDLSKVISLVGTDAFETLDRSKIPNASGVTAKPAVAADQAQAFRGTTVILAYNSNNVTDVPTTTDELYEWIENNPGRFAYNTPGTGGAGDSFVRTTVYNYIDDEEAMMSDDPKWEEQWDEGFAKLAELHPYMYQSGGTVVYPNKNQGALDLLSQGEVDMVPMWADMLLSQRAAGTVPEYIKLTSITPSFTGSVQCLMVPSFGSNPDGAYSFIDFMLSPTAQELLVKEMAAIPLIDVSGMDMTGYEDLNDLDVSAFRVMSIGSLEDDFNERWDIEISTLQ